MTNRKFYKTVIQVEVLSEDPFEWEDLSDVCYAITEGDCSGKVEEIARKEINGKECARRLIQQESDPGFFHLTEDGEDDE